MEIHCVYPLGLLNSADDDDDDDEEEEEEDGDGGDSDSVSTSSVAYRLSISLQIFHVKKIHFLILQEVDDQIFKVLAEKQQLLQEQAQILAVLWCKWKMDLICRLFSE